MTTTPTLPSPAPAAPVHLRRFFVVYDAIYARLQAQGKLPVKK